MALFEDTFAPYVPFGSRTLSLQSPRMTGTDVAILQAVYNLMLKTMNPPQGPMGDPVEIDGTFGSATQMAVQNIQSYFHLVANGVADSNTYFVFGQGVGANTTYGGPVYGSRDLTMGTSGGDVTILQNRLNCFRYSSIIGKPASGSFDAGTAQAVLAFKTDAVGNGDTGFPDTSTAGNGFYDASWLYTFAGGRAIMTGRNGFDVVFTQALLQKLGYYPGLITGYYDGATRAAVVAFQMASGINADGVVGPQTFYRFGLANSVVAPSPLTAAWPAAPRPPLALPCGVLLKKTANAGLYDIAGISLIESKGTEWRVTVSAVNLPNPVVYGNYNTYIGDVVFREVNYPIMLTQTAPSMQPDVYSGATLLTPGTPSFIRVLPYNSRTDTRGPEILQGNIFDCRLLTSTPSATEADAAPGKSGS